MNRIKVVYVDGSEQEAAAGAAAKVEFERKFGMAFADAFHPRVQGEPRAHDEWGFYFTWAGLKLNGVIGDEAFDDWLKRVDDITVLEAEEDRPTKRDRRPANSSS